MTEDILFFPMEPVLIKQVIVNLLENAVVHANSKKPIEFTVTENANQVTFQVKDYGIGIAPERLSTIFDGTPYTSEQVSDMHKGIGIGLSICKTIIVAHSGTIHATNHENGCIFTFTLPKEGK